MKETHSCDFKLNERNQKYRCCDDFEYVTELMQL